MAKFNFYSPDHHSSPIELIDTEFIDMEINAPMIYHYSHSDKIKKRVNGKVITYDQDDLEEEIYK